MCVYTHTHSTEVMKHNKIDTYTTQDIGHYQFFFEFPVNSSPYHSSASTREAITALNFLKITFYFEFYHIY